MLTQKLVNVQKNLMGIHIKSTALDTLIPLIFKECVKEKVMFYFTFVENTAILKLRDLESENKELNIRLYHENITEYETLKKALLINAFLITSKKEDFTQSRSFKNSEKRQDEIISTDTPTPAPIQRAIEKIQKKGVPVDRRTIERHIDLGSMGADVRKKCIHYLKNMDEGV